MPRLIYDKEKIQAAWKTGKYSKRGIAKEFGVSVGLAYKLCTGVEQEIDTLVNAKIELNQKVALLNNHDRSQFEREFEERSKHIDLITNATHVNVNRMMGKFNKRSKDYQPDLSAMDHKVIQSTIRDARESLLGKEQPQQITNINSTTNTVQLTREQLLDRLAKANEFRSIIESS